MWETFCVIITVIVILGESFNWKQVPMKFHFFENSLDESASEYRKYKIQKNPFLQLI